MYTLTQLMEGLLGRGENDIYLKDGSDDHWEEGEEEVVEGDGPG